MESASTGEVGLLEENHVAVAELRQVVGGGTSHDASADVHRPRLSWKGGEASALFEIGPCGLETLEVEVGVGEVVKVDLGLTFRHHAPHRLTEE